MLSMLSLPDPYYHTQKFSIGEAIRSLVFKGRVTGLERELSDETARKMGRTTDGFFMPLKTRATYATSAPETGGRLVATQLLTDEFVDVLRSRSVTQSLGATMLTGLVGNISIPRQASATQTYWVTENSALTQAEATFDNVTLSPKILGTRSVYTRLMLQQSTPDIESIIRNDLASGLAIELDRVALAGTGQSNQPLGVLNQTNIPTYAMGATGGPFINSSATAGSGIDPLIELEGLVAGSNAPVNNTWGYVTNSRVTAALRKLRASGDFSYLRDRPVFSSGAGPVVMSSGLPVAPMVINGYPLYSTNNVPSNLTKSTGSNLSAVIFGCWSELLIALWGGLEIVSNPYGSDDFARGNVSIRAMLTCDVAVKHVNSFAVIKDVVA